LGAGCHTFTRLVDEKDAADEDEDDDDGGEYAKDRLVLKPPKYFSFNTPPSTTCTVQYISQ
jgi:hypothetical protein